MSIPLALLLFGLCTPAFSQAVKNFEASEERLTYGWPAQWISHPTASAYDFGVFHFRKSFDLDTIPHQVLVNLSADNRYRLWINGAFVVAGPSRGDILHWRFETIDIAPFLRAGKNTIAAQVWNYGLDRPVFQISLRTAFLLQAEHPDFQYLNTGKDWLVIQNRSYKPLTGARERLNAYLVTGPRLEIDGKNHPWGWEQPDYDDSAWVNARNIRNAHPRGNGTEFTWELVPREIPLMYEEMEGLIQQRRDGATIPFLQNGLMIIPADTTIEILLDQTYLTNAYPYLQVSQGAGSSIKLEYAEAMFDDKGLKGNRNEIEGKTVQGYFDRFLPDGGRRRLFTTPWFRTWRYINMTITTTEKPLLIEKFYSKRTGYPFEEKAVFQCDQPQISDVWDVGWRTAELCAGETYYDCPYYEQLQYVGDTRIQALISLYVSGDDRLMRKAIRTYDDSRLANGLTMSRHPAYLGQIIPPYSLFWIHMVSDYWMHRSDDEFVKSMLPGIRTVLEWHQEQIDPETQLLGTTKFWNFVDWTDEWPWDPVRDEGGVPPTDGGSSILSLQLAYTLQAAIPLMEQFGEEHLADEYREWLSRLKAAIREHCWDEKRQLFADTPDKETYSQHANIMAILSNMVPAGEQAALLERSMQEEDLIQVTFYYRFYLMQALFQTGMGNRYLQALQPWFDMLDLGLTTFAEKPDPTRSDCHAWSASPNYDLLATVAGIRPDGPGFKEVLIQPYPGDLEQFTASMPHPDGTLEVAYRKENGKDHFTIKLPEGITGRFVYDGQEKALSGKETLEFEF
ncbi:alpha-L-rhamnosidase [Flavilitoribacter nigricans DSM 23189 = NBRC 102662]|uniref:Alpha-L-rhamnosidase n=1 Tax=Flavilitoribacter nigricans (strain ATCC 23147 / DSM 23189 / NBRC 102662 / NCIMB 1420 / SS-2) TaxID=1122177 RepID=A0A2D0NDN9_FLAN2|nr:alpha-L-rhamnosidase [Flavilitoribacter nigricans DSM 23189 = NBRC 102662]